MNRDPFEERVRAAIKLDAFSHDTPPTLERVQSRIENNKSQRSWGWQGVWSVASAAAVVVLVVLAVSALRPPQGSPIGSEVSVRTQEPLPSSGTPPPCPAAQLRGELMADEVEGVVVLEDLGQRWAVIWPHGFVARINAGNVELLDEDGMVVARQGDQIVVGGGEYGPRPDPAWLACGEIEVISEAPPD